MSRRSLFALLPLAGAALLAAGAAGCGGPRRSAAAFVDLSRVSAVEVTDALAFDPRRAAGARRPVVTTDPDALLRIERWLDGMADRWEPARGEPRSVRFQARLLADGRPALTLWIEPGYVQASDGGKRLRGARLSSAETATLAAALGLHPSELAPPPKLPDSRGPKPPAAGVRTHGV